MRKCRIRRVQALLFAAVLTVCSSFSLNAAAKETDLVANGGFELKDENQAWTITPECSDSLTAEIKVSDKDSLAKTGNGCLKFWGSGAYAIQCYQTVTVPETGYYKMQAFAEGGPEDGKENHCLIKLYIKDTAGKEVKSASGTTTAWSEWQKISADSIYLEAGEAVIGLEISGGGGEWGTIDDVSLVKGTVPAGSNSGSETGGDSQSGGGAGSGGSQSASGSSPKTGDAFPAGIAAVMLAAGAAVMILKKRESKLFCR